MVTEFDSGAVDVTATETTIFDTETGPNAGRIRGAIETIFFDVFNTGANDLLNFKVYVKGSSTGTYKELNTAWAAAGATLLYFSSNLAVLPATSGVGCAAVRIYGAYAFKITAKCDTAQTAIVRVHGVGKG